MHAKTASAYIFEIKHNVMSKLIYNVSKTTKHCFYNVIFTHVKPALEELKNTECLINKF